MMFFLVLEFIKCLWKLIGLLSDYHNTEKYSELLGPLPLKLPLICEVSHKIPLIDESKQLKHRLPKCPEAFLSELTQKIE